MYVFIHFLMIINPVNFILEQHRDTVDFMHTLKLKVKLTAMNAENTTGHCRQKKEKRIQFSKSQFVFFWKILIFSRKK